MTGDESTANGSYESRMRRMQELEEQLARERAMLSEMDSEKRTEVGNASPQTFMPRDVQRQPPRSLLAQDDFDDLQVPDTRYSENLLLPDDMDESPHTVRSLQSMTNDFSLEDTSDPETSGPGTDADIGIGTDTDIGTGTDTDIGIGTDTHSLSMALEDGQKDVEIEIRDYRNDIEEFRARGYNVSRMYNIFSRDIDTIRQSMLQYMQDVNQLKEIEKELELLETTGFERDVHSLHALLKNPDMLTDAKSFFDDLRERIGSKDTAERALKIRELENLFDGVMKEFSGVSDRFQTEIDDIKVSIIDLETAPISEYRSVRKMIFDLKDSMIHEKLAKEKEDEMRSMIDELQEWSIKGFNVTEVESTIKSDLKLAREMYDDFVKSAGKLLEFESELNSMKIKGFESEANGIREIIRDTEKVFLVGNKMESLGRHIRLSGIQNKMERMRSPAGARRSGPSRMDCPKCGGTVPIPSDERPLKVNCSSCHTEFHLKRVPSPEKAPAAAQQSTPVGTTATSVPSAAGTTASIPSPAPIEVTPIGPADLSSGSSPSAGQEKCPKCGAGLLPDSVFCGLCGHRTI